ncbi:hypothetical protein L218DRAFT_975135 [Marasmius fiardii PR-910]|nr:hypothetical protein L218DRAFT_975135 [Marasmius fiardii PR-910]
MWQHGWDLGDICTAMAWKKLLEELGTVTRPPSMLCGHPCIIALAALQACQEVYDQNPDTYLDELQWYLAIHQDIAISISALKENLDKAGLTHKILHKMSSYESSKDEREFSQCYGWAPIGFHADTTAPLIWGDWYSLITAMSMNGYMATYVVEGSVDAAEYFELVVEEVVPQMNCYPANCSVLVMDNCHIHHTKILQEYSIVVEVGNSPYSGSIEPQVFLEAIEFSLDFKSCRLSWT